MRCLVGIIISPPPVASKDATGAGEEANEEGNEGTQGEPVCIPVLSADSIIPDDVPSDPPKYHVDDPNNEGAQEGKARDEGHEYDTRAVVRSSTNTEEDGKTRKAGGCRK